MIRTDDILSAVASTANGVRSSDKRKKTNPKYRKRTTDAHDWQNCKACGGKGIACTDSRPGAIGDVGITRRRRRCLDCGETYTTYEMRQSDLEAMAAATSTSDSAAEVRMLGALFRAMGVGAEKIIAAMAEAGK